jgi:hypothetical protein
MNLSIKDLEIIVRDLKSLYGEDTMVRFLQGREMRHLHWHIWDKDNADRLDKEWNDTQKIIDKLEGKI